MASEAPCSLCQSAFQNPLLLWPCMHTFCQDCLGGWETQHSLRLPNQSTCIICPRCNQLALMQGSLDHFPRSTSVCNAAMASASPPGSPMLCREEVRARLREARCQLEQRQKAVFDSLAIVRWRVPEVHMEAREKKEEVKALITSIQEELVKRQHYLCEQLDVVVEQDVSYCRQRTHQLTENTSLLANFAEGLSDLMNRSYRDCEVVCEHELSEFLCGVEQVCSTAVTTSDERIPMDTPRSFRMPSVDVSLLVDSVVFDCSTHGPPPGYCPSFTCGSGSPYGTCLPSCPISMNRQHNNSENASDLTSTSPRSSRECTIYRGENKRSCKVSFGKTEMRIRSISAPTSNNAYSVLSDVSLVSCRVNRSSSTLALISTSSECVITQASASRSTICKEADAGERGDVEVKVTSISSTEDRQTHLPNDDEGAGEITSVQANAVTKEPLQVHEEALCAMEGAETSCDQLPAETSNQHHLAMDPIHSTAVQLSIRENLAELNRLVRTSCSVHEYQRLSPIASGGDRGDVNAPLPIKLPSLRGILDCIKNISGITKSVRMRSGSLPQLTKLSGRSHSLDQPSQAISVGTQPERGCRRSKSHPRHSLSPRDRNCSSKSPSDATVFSSDDLIPLGAKPASVAFSTVAPLSSQPSSAPSPSGQRSSSATGALTKGAERPYEKEMVLPSTSWYGSTKGECASLPSATSESSQPWLKKSHRQSTYFVLSSSLPEESKLMESVSHPHYEKQGAASSKGASSRASMIEMGETSNDAVAVGETSSESECKGTRERRVRYSKQSFAKSLNARLPSPCELPSTRVHAGRSSQTRKGAVLASLNVDCKMTLSERGPLIAVSWDSCEAADQYKVSTYDLAMAEMTDVGKWKITSRGSYLNEVFTTATMATLVHTGYDHSYAITVAALALDGSLLARSAPRVIRTPRHVHFENVHFDPQSCHPDVAVDSSLRGLFHRKSPFSFTQEERVMHPLLSLPGALGCHAFPSNASDLDLLYWECRINFKVIVYARIYDSICNVGLNQASSVDKVKNLGANRRGLCCMVSQDGFNLVLQFWDGWRRTSGLSSEKMPILEMAQQRETSLGLGFFLAFSRRSFVVVDTERNVVLHHFRLPRREVEWVLATSLHNQKNVPTTVTWLRPLTLPGCLLKMAS